MLPALTGILSGGAGGLSASSSADSRTGAVTTGGWNFAPKSSQVPPVAWIAAGVVLLVFLLKR